MAIDFQGAHFPKSVILYAVFFYVRYSVSYRDLEEIMVERGVNVDHATLNRWVVRYAPRSQSKPRKVNAQRLDPGVLTRPISRSKENGRIYIGPLIVMGKRSILCSPSGEISVLQGVSLRKP